MSELQCNGICITAWDVGVMDCPPDTIAYPHPDCELHNPQTTEQEQP